MKRRPWNTASFPDRERAVTFIKNYAEAHALPLPGRMPKFYDYSIMLLPSDVSMASVHRAVAYPGFEGGGAGLSARKI